jgi:hypothetical protein
MFVNLFTGVVIMAYEDVPQRLRDGEAVPRSEIIGYWGSHADIVVTYCLEVMVTAGIMVKLYEDETAKYQLTALGSDIRSDFLIRLLGDCPECPECP